MTTPPPPKFYAVVPAAGIGKRMGGVAPKQYLPLCGSTIAEQTLNKLLSIVGLEKIIVAVSPGDNYWPALPVANDPRIERVPGGAERAHSVLNGLQSLSGYASDNDWVLVHDVARPCVDRGNILSMMSSLADHAVGGILAVAVSDTVKQVAGTTITGTVDRSQLWLAQTPQMFRLGMLRQALQSALDRGAVITDEASAIEMAGYQPLVVKGSSRNLKITHPEDLALAEYYLAQEGCGS